MILVLMLIVSTNVNGQTNRPYWKVDPINYSYDMEVTAQVFINNLPVKTNGMLGAFVDGVLQGVQSDALTYAGNDLFIVRVYSNSPASQTVTFKYYDASADKVYDISETTPFVADQQSGSAVAPKLLHATLGSSGKSRPDWSVNAREFTYDGEIIAGVMIDKTLSTQANGILAAFAGNTCRGVVTGGLVGPTGKFGMQLRCYSDVASGEPLAFKYYDAVKDTVLALVETVDFESNMMLGSAVAPYVFHNIATLTASRNLASGWNWFSMNLQNTDMSVGAVLANLNPTEGDYLKSQTQSAYYYAGYGWFGDLQTIDPKQMYKIRLTHADVLKFEGYPVDPAANPINIRNGWSWIGYLPQTAKTMNVALASINPVANDYIKNTSLSDMFYTGSGWFGGLTEMKPLEGYILKTSHTAILTYAGSELKSISPVFLANAGGSVTPESFQYSGQITASAYLDGQNINGDSYTLYSIVDGQIRGESHAMLFAPTGEYINSLLTFSNAVEGEKVTFRLHDQKNDTWYEYAESITFRADMLTSTAFTPLKLQSSKLIESRVLSLDPSISVSPNPISSNATIHYAISSDQTVNIQVVDYSGRIVNELDLGSQTAGDHQMAWDTTTLGRGIYYLKMKNSPTIYQKVVIVR